MGADLEQKTPKVEQMMTEVEQTVHCKSSLDLHSITGPCGWNNCLRVHISRGCYLRLWLFKIMERLVCSFPQSFTGGQNV